MLEDFGEVRGAASFPEAAGLPGTPITSGFGIQSKDCREANAFFLLHDNHCGGCVSHRNFIDLSLHDRTKHKCELLRHKMDLGLKTWTQKYLYRLSAHHRDSIPYERKPDSFLF